MDNTGKAPAGKSPEDDIVDMLDSFMVRGGGHMYVDVIALEGVPEVTEAGANECGSKNMACVVPTLHEGIDDENDE